MKILNIGKYNLSKEQLINFGFEKDTLVFRKNILSDEFRIEIKLVDKTFEIEVYDVAFGEVYPLFSVDSAGGEVVANVREEVEKILKEILKIAGEKSIYEEILNYTIEKYGDTTKPFGKFPGIIALVTPKEKWYALLLDVEYNKLASESPIKTKVKITNLKHNSEEIPKIIDGKNIFPSYHMSKKHWISVVLDENISIEYLKELVDISYNLVSKK